MNKKLSAPQWRMLCPLTRGEQPPGVSRTLQALQRRGLIAPVYPEQTPTDTPGAWQVTEQGHILTAPPPLLGHQAAPMMTLPYDWTNRRTVK